MTNQDIINKFESYIDDYISVPRNEFSGLSICPFAHKAKIHWIVGEFNLVGDMIDEVKLFKDDLKYEVLIFIDRRDCSSFWDKLVLDLGETIKPLIVFEGSPNNTFEIAGVRTRCDPFYNIQVIRPNDLEEARQILKKGNYYNAWSKEDFDKIR